MRWTLVTETYPPEINGVAMTLQRLTTTLAAQGWEVAIVRPRQKADRKAASGEGQGNTAAAAAGRIASSPIEDNALQKQAAPPQAQAAALQAGSLAAQCSKQPHGDASASAMRAVNAAAQAVRTDFVLGLPIPGYSGLLFGRLAVGRLKKLWRKNRPDVVHIATEGPLGFSALFAAKALGIPVVTTFHTNFHSYGDHYRFSGLKRTVMAYLKWFHNRTLATFAPSADVIAQLEADGVERLRLMGRGVDTALFGRHRRSGALRQQWGVAEGSSPCEAPVVLYAGRIAGEKNLPLTLRAFERLRTHLPAAKMVIVGDGPLRAKLERENPHIHFAGMRRGEDLAAHYASADLFCFSSVTETFGNVVTEAMASGLVVLGYDYAAPARFIEDGVNGFKASFGDEAAFLLAVDRMAGARMRWPQVGAAAAEAMAAVSWSRVIGEYAQAVEQIVADFVPPPTR